MESRSRAALGALLAVALCALPSCGGHAQNWWRVFHQASPNPMIHRHDFVIAPMLFDQINIEGRSEAEFMTMPPDVVERYVDGKARMVNAFLAVMSQSEYRAAPLPPDTQSSAAFVIRPQATYLRFLHRTRNSTQFGQSTGALLVHMQIFTPDGTLLDDVRITAPENGGEREANIGGQMEVMGRELGNLLVRYLQTRTDD